MQVDTYVEREGRRGIGEEGLSSSRRAESLRPLGTPRERVSTIVPQWAEMAGV